MTDVSLLDVLKSARDRRQIEEDRERFKGPGSLYPYIVGAFPQVKKRRPFMHGWHIQAICAHLEAITFGDIDRLQVWVPPGTMKSMSVHVFWQTWEWGPQEMPWIRAWCASHSLGLVWKHCEDTKTVLESEWFTDRWGQNFSLTSASKTALANDQGGTRFTTSPSSEGVGQHGDRIILDDLLDAADSEATTAAVLNFTNEWYDATVAGRKEVDAAEILIMQRLHENDSAAHALEVGDWTVLCLPERFEEGHDYAWRGERVLPQVAERLWGTGLENGDPRNEGDLIWPEKRGEKASDEYAKRLKSFRAAGQLQQRPAAKEGLLLLRQWWRFYDARIREQEDWKQLGTFRAIVISCDTPLKDKETSDNIAIQCYGVRGADRYLLDLVCTKMNFGKAKRTIREMALWSRKHWPTAAHYVLIENAGYGVELITDLKREITGVTKVPPGPDGNKVSRAESASDALESGNVFVPGFGPPWQPVYDETRSPDDIRQMIHNFALFPNAQHDDDVDAWSQAMNWLRSRNLQPARTASAVAPRR